MGNKSSRRLKVLSTRSLELLEERVRDFSAVEFTDRWKRYDVGEELGRGAMGQVFRALDTQLRREVAVKCVIEGEGDSDQVVDRFLDEIVLHARLTHPAIAPIYDFGLTPEGHLFMSMELVFGDSFQQIVQRYHESELDQENLHLNDLLARFMKVCDAMSFAHGLGIIHRDLKPENIMCGEFGEVFVMDWGLATTIDSAVPQSGHIFDGVFSVSDREKETARREMQDFVEKRIEKAQRKRHQVEVDLAHKSMMGNVVGTVGYLAPEQALGRSVGHSADIYSLSCILYEILCGRAPVSSDGSTDVWALLDSVIDGRILPPNQRGSKHRISNELSDIAMKGLSRDPRHRFNSVDEMRTRLLAWIRKQSMARQMIIEIEDSVVEAERKVAANRPEEARLLLSSALESLEIIEDTEKLQATVRGVLEDADTLIAKTKERSEAGKAFRELRATVIESQFGLILGHLRLPAPTIRRAHDRLFTELQSAGVWTDPVHALKRFKELGIEQRQAGGEADLREQLVAALFLFGWVSTRMAMVTSESHGKDMFERHAEQAMKKLQKLSKNYRAPFVILARLASMRDDPELAKHLEEKARATYVRGADDHTFLATVAFVDYRIEDALENLEAALGLDPSEFWAHALMIFVHYGLGDRKATFSALRTAQALQPREPTLWAIRGFLLREYGEFEEAHEALGRALRYGPNDPLSRLMRADLRLRLGRIDWERDLDTAGDLVTPPKVTWDYFVLALIALYKHDTEYAREFVLAAMMRSPGMPQLYGLEASILMRIGDFEIAEKQLTKALEMAPSDPRLTETLLSLLIHQKRYGEARSRFQEDELRSPAAITPNILLLAARSYAGYAGKDGDDDDTSDLEQAMILLRRAADMQVLARSEVDQAPEFSQLRERYEFKKLLGIFRDGPPVPRLFQPSLEDLRSAEG